MIEVEPDPPAPPMAMHSPIVEPEPEPEPELEPVVEETIIAVIKSPVMVDEEGEEGEEPALPSPTSFIEPVRSIKELLQMREDRM